MKISFIEIRNFRKLKSTHIDFDQQTTLFVGANNSGKTSAMLALRYFFVSQSKLSLRDVTVANWARIDAIGTAWEAGEVPVDKFPDLLPSLDVWLNVALSEIHHVIHILPTINWSGGLIGVRLQYEPLNIEKLRADYILERVNAIKIFSAVNSSATYVPPRTRPASLSDYLEKKLSKYLDLNAYVLNPALISPVEDGVAKPQDVAPNIVPLEKDPFKSLIRVDEISAQSDFAEAGDGGEGTFLEGKNDSSSRRLKKPLSDQLRSYYNRHLDPAKSLTVEDLDALGAIQQAERTFDKRLKNAFTSALSELEDLGYPGINNPKIKINTQFRATDGLKHSSALEYEVIDPTGDGSNSLHLPEHHSGLGYQRLISMVFMLMSYRDEWMYIDKDATLADGSSPNNNIQPLHLVLVEEPEAHLHAQVQQVFIKKAYALLRKHDDLGDLTTYSTQLIVSTHSSHVAHEADFSNLRYFRRRHPKSSNETATSTVQNLSTVFGDADETQKFVKRYLKATHCDLFFADAAIFVEGQAERILIPHFIRYHFFGLSRRYITLLDLGGSHAHSFKKLVDELGLTTLIISDLDAAISTEITKKGSIKSTVLKAVRPQKGAGHKTTNPVLKSWHPKLENIDDLLALKAEGHITAIGEDCDLYVAYQKAVKIKSEAIKPMLVIPRTFEDALIFENQTVLETLSGSAITNKIKDIVTQELSGDELSDALFEMLKKAEKAAFALDCLLIEDPKSLLPPTYVREGLSWLQVRLDEKTRNDLKMVKNDV